MRGSRLIASPAVGVLVLLGIALPAAPGQAQQAAAPPMVRLAALGAGSITGVVQDERGLGISGALVTAVGATTAFATADRGGYFELRTLSPGPYLVRAHLAGFQASRGEIVEVRPGTRAASAIALRHVTDTQDGGAKRPVIEAGLTAPPTAPTPSPEEPATEGTAGATIDDDHGEVAWRLRHGRRSVLKDTVFTDDIAAGDSPDNVLSEPGFFGSASRLSANLFSGVPFTGQFNLLTTGSFDSPLQMFSTDTFARSVAFLSLRAPVGDHGGWAAKGAVTQGDIASWIVAAAYSTHGPARHQYDVGVSYATQRYQGGNLAALREVSDGSRNAAEVYGFDTFTLNPSVKVNYGARVARYDYLDRPSLVSPRVEVTLTAEDQSRVTVMASRRAIAPGAEEFMPPVDSNIWLPPQRTFSTLAPGGHLDAEQTNHLAVALERDIAHTNTTIILRAFRQQVSDQLATVFGLDMPGTPTRIGHYFVADAGDVSTLGWSAGAKTTVAGRVHGTVEYSLARATTDPIDDRYLVLMAPAAVRPAVENLHSVITSVETEVPETATRVFVFYQVSRSQSPARDNLTPFDSRFDLQVRQSLPFMDFSSARWEMLLAVRNVFRETSPDASIYDELLVVHPPKRIVGGLTLHF